MLGWMARLRRSLLSGWVPSRLAGCTLGQRAARPMKSPSVAAVTSGAGAAAPAVRSAVAGLRPPWRGRAPSSLTVCTLSRRTVWPMKSILICDGHDAGVTTGRADETLTGQGIALLLDYNLLQRRGGDGRRPASLCDEAGDTLWPMKTRRRCGPWRRCNSWQTFEAMMLLITAPLRIEEEVRRPS